MRNTILSSAVTLLVLARAAAAVDCSTHTFGTCADNIVHWYDPDTGEICDPLDCGGGRAPPKTNVPGCPLYTGTDVLATSKSFMPCFKAMATTTGVLLSTPPSSLTPTDATSSPTFVEVTSSPTFTSVVSTETITTSPGTTTTPSITSLPTLTPTSSRIIGNGTHISVPGSSSTSGTSTTPVSTPNAAPALGGSLMAIAGAAIGAVVLV